MRFVSKHGIPLIPLIVVKFQVQSCMSVSVLTVDMQEISNKCSGVVLWWILGKGGTNDFVEKNHVFDPTFWPIFTLCTNAYFKYDPTGH